MSHNELYATSWEMDFSKQIDEYTMPEVTSEAEQPTIQETTHTDDEATKQTPGEAQTERTEDDRPKSPDFSNLTTDVGENPYMRRPHPLKVHLVPTDLCPLSFDITREKQRNIGCDLILNLMLILTSDDLTL